MDPNEETMQKFSALNEVKLSDEDKADILQALRIEMNHKKPKRKFNGGAISGFAAAAAAVVIVAGGFGLEMRHHQSPSASNGLTAATNQTHANNATSPQNTVTPSNSTVSNATSPSNNTASNTTPSSNDAANRTTHGGSTNQNTSQSSSNYANEIALVKGQGYDVSGTQPNASVPTSSGGTLTAWIGVRMQSDGYNQLVFFFLDGKYLGTDTSKANPSMEITSAKPAGTGAIAVTYPVYKAGDPNVHPTGTPVTITYTWNGSKLVPNKPYPKQFG